MNYTFENGVLICGQTKVKVILGKDDSIQLNGMISPDYIKVRNAIHELLTIV